MTAEARRVALVTGAAGDIGAACAIALEASGLRVLRLDRAIPPGQAADWFACDLADPVAVHAAIAAVTADLGRLDVVVNVAGINHQATVQDIRVSDWTRMLDVNAGGMFAVLQACQPLLAQGQNAAVVNMSSVSGHVASTDYPAYVATKAAVEGLTQALALEWALLGIRVNAVAPGWVEAGFTRAALATAADPDALQEAARRAHLLGRMAQASEVAEAVAFLASPASSGTNGQVLFVDGGLMRVH